MKRLPLRAVMLGNQSTPDLVYDCRSESLFPVITDTANSKAWRERAVETGCRDRIINWCNEDERTEEVELAKARPLVRCHFVAR